MDRTLPTVIAVLVIAVILAGMYWGWRTRSRAQSSMARPLPVPAEHGTAVLERVGAYVATTTADDPLDRIVVPGLGYRARAVFVVTTTGIVVSLDGSPDFYIPSADLRDVRRTTWTIDRAVERDGLVCVTWMLGESPVDSYFRFAESPDPSDIVESIHQTMIGVADQEGRD